MITIISQNDNEKDNNDNYLNTKNAADDDYLNTKNANNDDNYMNTKNANNDDDYLNTKNANNDYNYLNTKMLIITIIIKILKILMIIIKIMTTSIIPRPPCISEKKGKIIFSKIFPLPY